MLIRDVIKLSKINVSRGRVRTVLTILSITIGIASVLLVSSIGSTGERILINEIEKMGLQGISVFNENNAEELTDRDVTLLKKRFREIESATPMIMDVGSFDFSRISGTAVLIGVGEESTDVYNIRIVHGRKPTIDEIEEKKRVAAIDDELALKAYKRTNVVGKQISVTINGKKENFDIISVIKSQKDGLNRMSGNNIPDFIYLPYTALNEMRGTDKISQITIKTATNTEDGAKFATFLNKIHRNNSYKSENVSSKIDEVKSVTGLISLLITAIASIALCVAGVGIMNSMLSSCIERKREIGVSMAIGAGFSDILICFLTEAVLIALIGGSLGAGIGIILAKSVFGLIGIEFVFEYRIFIVAEIISVLFGIVFSLLPAIKAAKMDPISALRRD